MMFHELFLSLISLFNSLFFKHLFAETFFNGLVQSFKRSHIEKKILTSQKVKDLIWEKNNISWIYIIVVDLEYRISPHAS